MSAIAMRSRGWVLVLLAALAPLAGPALAQASGGSGAPSPSPLQRILGPILQQATEPDALTASYSGALSFSGPYTHITASVTQGRVQCTGSMSTGDGGSISYAGKGRIDLELGLSTEDDQGQRLNDLYRITLHCPMNAPGHEGRSLADIANTAYQPGGRVSRSLQGPELLKGVWRENDEEFSWHLCRSNCRPPP